MNGEPFCYGSRLTVRQLLELRSNDYDLTRILKDHPELRVLGIAAQTSFRAVAILPAVLLVVFGAIWLYDRGRDRRVTKAINAEITEIAEAQRLLGSLGS